MPEPVWINVGNSCPPSQRQQANRAMLEQIKAVHQASRQTNVSAQQEKWLLR